MLYILLEFLSGTKGKLAFALESGLHRNPCRCHSASDVSGAPAYSSSICPSGQHLGMQGHRQESVSERVAFSFENLLESDFACMIYVIIDITRQESTSENRQGCPYTNNHDN